jgi:predicted Zn-ribbon and HTH transcriptional regulator
MKCKKCGKEWGHNGIEPNGLCPICAGLIYPPNYNGWLTIGE